MNPELPIASQLSLRIQLKPTHLASVYVCAVVQTPVLGLVLVHTEPSPPHPHLCVFKLLEGWGTFLTSHAHLLLNIIVSCLKARVQYRSETVTSSLLPVNPEHNVGSVHYKRKVFFLLFWKEDPLLNF